MVSDKEIGKFWGLAKRNTVCSAALMYKYHESLKSDKIPGEGVMLQLSFGGWQAVSWMKKAITSFRRRKLKMQRYTFKRHVMETKWQEFNCGQSVGCEWGLVSHEFLVYIDLIFSNGHWVTLVGFKKGSDIIFVFQKGFKWGQERSQSEQQRFIDNK